MFIFFKALLEINAFCCRSVIYIIYIFSFLGGANIVIL